MLNFSGVQCCIGKLTTTFSLHVICRVLDGQWPCSQGVLLLWWSHLYMTTYSTNKPWMFYLKWMIWVSLLSCFDHSTTVSRQPRTSIFTDYKGEMFYISPFSPAAPHGSLPLLVEGHLWGPDHKGKLNMGSVALKTKMWINRSTWIIAYIIYTSKCRMNGAMPL